MGNESRNRRKLIAYTAPGKRLRYFPRPGGRVKPGGYANSKAQVSYKCAHGEHKNCAAMKCTCTCGHPVEAV
jgi:hypothetical protein